MSVACALFPVQNGVVKLLTGIYPWQEVVWVRLVTHLALMCVLFLPRRGLALLRTRAPLQPARDIVASAMDAIHADLPLEGELLVMLNGMGGTPLIELYGAYNEVSKYVTGHGARIARNLVGNYITSLEMQGFSVTVCRLTDALAQLWDAPVETPGLRWGQ